MIVTQLSSPLRKVALFIYLVGPVKYVLPLSANYKYFQQCMHSVLKLDNPPRSQ